MTPAKVAVPSGCVVIVEGLLLGAVRVVNAAEKAANAENVRVQLGKIADDGRYFDVWVVADDLADLESRGNSNSLPLSTGAAVSRRLRRASRT